MNEKHFHRAALCNEQLVRIDDVTPESRKSSIFTCLGCGGEMEACLGEVREHYFRHKNKENCSWESYLHKLSKLIIKARFEQQEKFLIYFNAVNSCSLLDDCPFHRCHKEFVSELNLKDYYDTCELEGTYRGYRADILLTHSEHPDRVLFLEIAVTHKCEEEKIASRIKIIEIDVINQQSAFMKLDENNEQVHFYNFKFKRDITPHTKVERFSLLATDNNKEFKQDKIDCCKFNEHLANAVFDIIIKKRNDKIGLNLLGLAQTMILGTNVRHCSFCENRGRCVVTFPKKGIDEKDGKEKVVMVLQYPDKLSNEMQWKAAEKCETYRPNIRGCHKLVKQYGSNNYILWKKNAH